MCGAPCYTHEATGDEACSDPACGWQPAPAPTLSRRRFFFLGLGAAAGAFVVPRFEVFAPPAMAPDYGIVDSVLKDVYADVVAAQINASPLFARIRLTHEEMVRSVGIPSAFLEAWRAEATALARDLQAREEAAIFSGRIVLDPTMPRDEVLVEGARGSSITIRGIDATIAGPVRRLS